MRDATPQRWEEVSRLFAAASELAAESRAAFLREACRDDDDLREEVESLLAIRTEAGEFLSQGVMLDAAKVLAKDGVESLVGHSLGHYTVVSQLGVGGMGEVYRAHDSRLGRDVAVKVLPAFATQSDSSRSRFHREAQAVAALSHPNIRSLYDVGEADGIVYAVMELLEGETLRARLKRGPVPARKAMEIGAAIADGLGAAHARGIVHRDIKPENVFITAGGHVKVLDFGLAKMPEPAGRHPNSLTVSGAILGTAAYMSPEQVSASEVDARSDIFSLGCVLYEMVSGRRPFERNTAAETMTAILNEDPPELETLGGDVRRLVAHCLEKQPEARFQSARDLAFQLSGSLGAADIKRQRPVRAFNRRFLWPAVAVLFIITTAVLLLVHFGPPPSPNRQVRFDISPPGNATLAGGLFALSPDGTRLAFVASNSDTPARRSLWIHSFDTGESQPLSGAGDAIDGLPVWSPDGRYIAFSAEGRIRKIPLFGGSPQTVVEAPSQSSVLAWSADDVILLQLNYVVMKVSATGGPTTPLTALDRSRGEMLHTSARFLPDDHHFLYVRSSFAEGMSGIFVGSVDAKPEQQDSRRLIATRGRVAYAPSRGDPSVGQLVFNREGTLWAQRFDAGRLKLTDEPVLVAEQLGEGLTPHRTGYFSISSSGALAYRRQEMLASVPMVLDPSGRKTTQLVDTPLTGPVQLRLAPDGRRIAAIVGGDVWVYDLSGRPPIRLTSGGGKDMLLWTPDGKHIVYSQIQSSQGLMSVPADGAGATPAALSPGGHFHPHGWSPDGSELIAALNTYSETGWDIVGIPMHENREPRAILRTPVDEGTAGTALSPDGRWLAYSSNATGETEIWVQAYPGPGKPSRVSPHGGLDPQWAKNGRTLYYLEKTRLMSVAVDDGLAFNFKPPLFLFEMPSLARFPNQSYDVGRDGRFVAINEGSTRVSAPPITVVLNWTAGMTK